MENKFTVKERFVNTLEVEKSKFIGVLQSFSSKTDVKLLISELKKEFPKARHYCFAYKSGNEFKYSDDGEPSGTAGKPIYSVLENSNLDNVILIVIRYFGGTLLGSGRLLRTYSKCAQSVVETAKLFKLSKKRKVRVEVSEDTYSTLINYLNKNGYIVLNNYFNDKIIVEFLEEINQHEDLESIFYGKLEILAKSEVDYLEG